MPKQYILFPSGNLISFEKLFLNEVFTDFKLFNLSKLISFVLSLFCNLSKFYNYKKLDLPFLKTPVLLDGLSWVRFYYLNNYFSCWDNLDFICITGYEKFKFLESLVSSVTLNSALR